MVRTGRARLFNLTRGDDIAEIRQQSFTSLCHRAGPLSYHNEYGALLFPSLCHPLLGRSLYRRDPIVLMIGKGKWVDSHLLSANRGTSVLSKLGLTLAWRQRQYAMCAVLASVQMSPEDQYSNRVVEENS